MHKPQEVAHCKISLKTPNNEADYTEELCQAISDLSNRHSKSILWIGDDANLPDIDWSNSPITSYDYYSVALLMKHCFAAIACNLKFQI